MKIKLNKSIKAHNVHEPEEYKTYEKGDQLEITHFQNDMFVVDKYHFIDKKGFVFTLGSLEYEWVEPSQRVA